MPRLIAPTADLYEQFLAAHREWGTGLHEDGFGIRPTDEVGTAAGFRAWVDGLVMRPARSWWIVDDGAAANDGGPRILGALALRPTEFTGDVLTGHIGYGVTPSARGRGVAAWALRTALGGQEARNVVLRPRLPRRQRRVDQGDPTMRRSVGTDRHRWRGHSPTRLPYRP